jgi:DNA polymerase-3 subunit delta'
LKAPQESEKHGFAMRCAAWLLGARGPADAPFDASVDDPVMSRCLSGGHPDLRILTRELNDKGKLKQDISIEQIRAFNEFSPIGQRWVAGAWALWILWMS